MNPSQAVDLIFVAAIVIVVLVLIGGVVWNVFTREPKAKTEVKNGANGWRWFNFLYKPFADLYGEKSNLFTIQKWIISFAFMLMIIVLIDWLLPSFIRLRLPFSIRDNFSIRWFSGATEELIFFFSLIGSVLCIFIRFIEVKESTARPIMRFGSFARMVYAKQDHWLNFDGLLEPKRGYMYELWGWIPWGEFFGGLRPYIWLLEEPYVYSWSWVKILPNGKLEPRDEDDTDHIKLGQHYAYGFEIKGDDSGGKKENDVVDINGVPLVARGSITGEIVDPRKALFETTHWFVVVMERILPPIRSYLSRRSYEDLRAEKDEERLGDAVFEYLKGKGEKKKKGGEISDIIKVLEDEYGFRAISIQFRKLVVREDYQGLLTEQWEAERISEKRSESTIGPILAMLAKAKGKQDPRTGKLDLKAIQDEIDADPEEFFRKHAELIKMNQTLVEQLIASDAGSDSALRRWYFEGDQGAMGLVAALVDTFKGASASSPPKPTKTP